MNKASLILFFTLYLLQAPFLGSGMSVYPEFIPTDGLSPFSLTVTGPEVPDQMTSFVLEISDFVNIDISSASFTISSVSGNNQITINGLYIDRLAACQPPGVEEVSFHLILYDFGSKVYEENSFPDEMFSFDEPFPEPFRITEFEASQLRVREIQVSWTTERETGTSHFELERAQDDGEFQYVASVPAAGSTYFYRNYNFYDLGFSLKSDDIYYRLKLVAEDSSYQCTQPVSLKNRNNKYETLNVAPNPTRNMFTIFLEEPIIEGGTMYLFTPGGKRLLEDFIEEGSTEHEVDVSDLPSGVYFVYVATIFSIQTALIAVQE